MKIEEEDRLSEVEMLEVEEHERARLRVEDLWTVLR